MPLNETFGWLWITLGFLSGALIGLGFLRDDFLGGYDSRPRRLIRLAHISFFGLGFINVLFATGSAPAVLAALAAPLLRVASWGLIAGAVLMPTCCLLVAWRAGLKPLFAAPVAALICAGLACVWGGAS